jgi:hypothetical protein
LTAVVVVLAVAVAVLGVLVVGLLRTHAEVLRRLSELGAGVYDDEVTTTSSTTGGVRSPVEIRTRPGVPEPRDQAEPVTATAFDVAGVTPDGSAVAAGVVGRDHTTLLAFLSSGCGTCADFWRAFGDGEGTRLPGRDTRLVIVTKGPTLESVSEVARLAPAGITTVMSDGAYDDYRVPANPYFILVDGPTGNVVGEGAAASWAQVANLLGQAAADAGHDLDGAPLTPSAPAGRLTGPERSRRADEELRAAGIGPGHPSLYPDQLIADDEPPEASLPGGGGTQDGRS